MKTRITFLALIAGSLLQAQTLVWSKQLNGNINPFHITTDASGNVFTTGWFSGTIDFDAGIGVFNLNSAAPSAYVTKSDANGNFLWVVNVVPSGTGAVSSNGRYDIETDQSGNVYIAGFFSGSCDFDPGQGVSSLTSYTSTTYFNSFVWKLDANGNFLWVKQLQGSQNISGIAVDASGNLLAVGNFSGTSDFDWGSGTANLTAFGTRDGFISKMSTSGNFLNVEQIGGAAAYSTINSISIDPLSDIYILGSFSGTIDVDPGNGTQVLGASSGNEQFSVKLNASLDLLSAFSIGKPLGSSTITAVANDAYGNTYVSGGFTGTCDFDPSVAIYSLQTTSGAAFVYKLDQAGNFVWAKKIDVSVTNIYTLLKLDPNGNIYFSSKFSGTVDVDPGTGTNTLTPTPNNVFLCSLNSSGNFVSAIIPVPFNVMAVGLNGDVYTASQTTCKYSSIYTGVGVNQKSALELSLFPNPGSGIFILNKPFKSECSVEVYNCSGGKVYSQVMVADSQSIDLENCAAGVYFIRVYGKENTIWTKKIIKQ